MEKRYIVILLIVILVAILLCNLLYYITTEFQNKKRIRRKFLNITPDVKIINIGSGPSLKAFDWDGYNMGENLAIAPENFRYDLRILKNYCSDLKENTIILHVICPLSFAKNVHLKGKTFSKGYVEILPASDVDLHSGDYFIEKYFPIISRPYKVCVAIFRKILNCEWVEPECLSEEDVNKRTNELVRNWLNDNPGLENFKDAEQYEEFEIDFYENIEDLKMIYEFCLGKKYRYFAVLTPLSEYMLSYFSTEFLDKFLYKNLNRSGIPQECILDYQRDSEFSKSTCYTNGLFLNTGCRKTFTKKVIGNLIKRGDLDDVREIQNL